MSDSDDELEVDGTEEGQATVTGGEEISIAEYQDFAHLRKLKDEKFCSSIRETVVGSAGEIILGALQVSSKHSFSNQALLDVLRLINSIFRKDVVPDTQVILDNLLFDKKTFSHNFYCKNCFTFLGENTDKSQTHILCFNCSENNKVSNLCDATYFVTADIAPQIEVILQEVGLDALVKPCSDF